MEQNKYPGPFCRDILLEKGHLLSNNLSRTKSENIKNGVVTELTRFASVNDIKTTKVADWICCLQPNLADMKRPNLLCKISRTWELHKKFSKKKKNAIFKTVEDFHNALFFTAGNMVARKSSRVKKSPVVYQAPEAVPRAVRAPSTPKQAVVNRRIFGKDVDLQMECVDDELSPAQLKALKEAQQEHDKANEMIKEVRAGNILVPSSQPNTFTIVPPKPPQPPPQQTPPPVQQQQAPPIQLQKLPSPPEEAGSQRGLPPPRPAQFLNRQLQEISKSQGSRAPEVLLISDNSAMTGGPKLTTQTLLGTQISTQPLQFQQMTLAGHQVTMSGGAGVMPQQVYKFVSLPSNMQPNIVPNQWALRPLLTVSPQQQQQMSLVGSNQQGVPQFATMTLAQQPRILPAQPAQVSGEELRKVGGAYSTRRNCIKTNLNFGATDVCHFENGWSLKKFEQKFRRYGLKNISSVFVKSSKKIRCICSKVYTMTVRRHCWRVARLFNGRKSCQVNTVPWREVYCWSLKYVSWHKTKRIRKARIGQEKIQMCANKRPESKKELLLLDRNCDTFAQNTESCAINMGNLNTSNDSEKKENGDKNDKIEESGEESRHGSYCIFCDTQLLHLSPDKPIASKDSVECRHSLKLSDNRTCGFNKTPRLAIKDHEQLEIVEEANKLDILDSWFGSPKESFMSLLFESEVRGDCIMNGAFMDSSLNIDNPKKYKDQPNKMEKVTLEKENMSSRTASNSFPECDSVKLNQNSSQNIEMGVSDVPAKQTRQILSVTTNFGCRKVLADLKNKEFHYDQTDLKFHQDKDIQNVFGKKLENKENLFSTQKCWRSSASKSDIWSNSKLHGQEWTLSRRISQGIAFPPVKCVVNMVYETKTHTANSDQNTVLDNSMRNQAIVNDENFEQLGKSAIKTNIFETVNKVPLGPKPVELNTDTVPKRLEIVGCQIPTAKQATVCTKEETYLSLESPSDKDGEECRSEDCWSDTSGEISDCPEEIENDESSLNSKRNSGKEKLYEKMTHEDKKLVVLLCSRHGFTKMSRELQIPKTVLLKWRRAVKRCQKSCETCQKSSSIENVVDLDLATDMHTFQVPCESVLQTLHPVLYNEAKNLGSNMKELNKTTWGKVQYNEQLTLLKERECSGISEDFEPRHISTNSSAIFKTGIEQTQHLNKSEKWRSEIDLYSAPVEDNLNKQEKINIENAVKNVKITLGNEIHSQCSVTESRRESNQLTDTKESGISSQTSSNPLMGIDNDGDIDDGDEFDDQNNFEYESSDRSELVIDLQEDLSGDDSVQEKEQEKQSLDHCVDLYGLDDDSSCQEASESCSINKTLPVELGDRDMSTDNTNQVNLQAITDDHCYESVQESYENNYLELRNLKKTDRYVVRTSNLLHLKDSITDKLKQSLNLPQFEEFEGRPVPILSSQTTLFPSFKHGIPNSYLSGTHHRKQGTFDNTIDTRAALNSVTNEIHFSMPPTDFLDQGTKNDTVAINHEDEASSGQLIIQDFNPHELNVYSHGDISDVNADGNSLHYVILNKAQLSEKPGTSFLKGQEQRKRNKSSKNGSAESLNIPKSTCETQHQTDDSIYTDDFLEFIYKNKALSSDCAVTEDAREYLLKEIKQKVKGDREIYLNRYKRDPEVLRLLIFAALKLGLKFVANEFGISHHKLVYWKKVLVLKLKKKYGKDNISSQMNGRKEKTSERKRIILSKELKIKLVNLARKCGQSAVSKQYNIPLRLLRTWTKSFEKEKLPSYELKAEELVELIEYDSYRENILRGKNNDPATEENNCCEELKGKDLSVKDKKVEEKSQDDTCQPHHAQKKTLFPSHFEVIITSDEEDSNIQQKTEKTEVGSDVEKDNPTINSNSSLLEMVTNNDTISGESDNDVIEIISWDVMDTQNGTSVEDLNENVADISRSKKEFQENVESGLVMQNDKKESEDEINVSVSNAKNEMDMIFVEILTKENRFDGRRLDVDVLDKVATEISSKSEDIIHNTKSADTYCKSSSTNSTFGKEKVNETTLVKFDDVEEVSVEKRSSLVIGDKCSAKRVVLTGENICSGEVISLLDEPVDSCKDMSELPFKLLSPSEIKDEPVDDEFDEVESCKSSNAFRKNKEKETGHYKHREEKPYDTTEYIKVPQDSESFSKQVGVTELGLGNGNESQSQQQGYNFQGNSGNTNSGTQGSSTYSISGFQDGSDSQLGGLPVDLPNVQIVGTHDLVPGQEYILVDPRVLTSGVNNFHTLRPPTLIRPQLRNPETASNQISYVPQMMGTSIRHVYTSRMPTPVHMVENRSLKTSPPASGIPVVSVRPQLSYVQTRQVTNETPTSTVSSMGRIATGCSNLPPLSMYGRSSTTLGGTHVSSNVNVQSKQTSPRSGTVVIVGQKASYVSPTRVGSNTSTQTVRSLLSGSNTSNKVSNNTPVGRSIKDAYIVEQIITPHTSTDLKPASDIVQRTSTHITFAQPVPGPTKDTAETKNITLSGIGTLSKRSVEQPGPSGLSLTQTSPESSNYQDIFLKTLITSKENTPRPPVIIPSKMFEKVKSDALLEKEQKLVSASEAMLEKEQKLLSAFLVKKSVKHTEQTDIMKPKGTLSTVTGCETKHGNQQQLASGSTRIGSLIERMASRVYKQGPDDLHLDSTLTTLELTKPTVPPGLSETQPASASEILFGKFSPLKKTEVSTKRPSSRASQSSEDSNASSLRTGIKNSRKNPLVFKDMESSDEESSNSSSVGSSVSSDSLDEDTEKTQGSVEKVDLSEKLKSLLSADIFNIIDNENSEEKRDSELLDISEPAKDDLSSNNKHGELKKNTEITRASEPKKGSITYSLNIKKKLGKLATMFSIVSLSKKYGINQQTLSKWKKKYQDEEIAGLSLTADELKEIDEKQELKKMLFGNSLELEYDIYVDNPEEAKEDDDDVINIGNDKQSKQNKGEMDSLATENDSAESPKKTLTEKTLWASKPKKISVQKVEAPKKELSKDGAPLYISLDENITEEVKKQLRSQIKAQKNVKDAVQKGVFCESANISTGSIFGTSDSISNTDSSKNSVSSIFGSKTDPPKEQKSSVKPSHDVERDIVKARSLLRDKESKTGETSPDVIWERTVYLCPDEGIFKYRYEMKKNEQGENTDVASGSSKPMPVLDSLFKASPDKSLESDGCKTSIKKPHHDISTSPASIASILKDSLIPATGTEVLKSLPKPRSDSLTSSSPETGTEVLKSLPKSRSSSAIESDHVINVDDIGDHYSQEFKWTVVKEARKSGFENTAKWYAITMTNIMKWHDEFLQEKNNKDLNDLKAQLIKSSTTSSVAASTGVIGEVVDLTVPDVNVDKTPARKGAALVGIPGKERSGKINASLSFERIEGKEGSITKPKFNTAPVISQTTLQGLNPINRQNRTRMGPNTIKYAAQRPDPAQLEKFREDVRGDLGIMPKLVKQPQSKDGVEIASTWKQVQSVLKPTKPVEKKYSQEFKNRLIRECEQRGQKMVALEYKIPYNEISRWRLEAKKSGVQAPKPKPSVAYTQPGRMELSDRASLVGSKDTSVAAAERKQSVSEPNNSTYSTYQYSVEEKGQSTEQESLKIKIKLSSIGQTPPAAVSNKKKPSDKPNEPKIVSTEITDSASMPMPQRSATVRSVAKKSTTPVGRLQNRPRVTVACTWKASHETTEKTKFVRSQSADVTTPVSIDGDNDMRMEVINFCFEHGVLKTQKKYNVTRQSIIDLMKEYDELNKYAVDSYNKSQDGAAFKTKLVSREKTSVEVTNTATQPVIVKNLNDYIVTQEYKESVVEYALKHGMTAASRKYKRKTSTVKTWIKEFQREMKKTISVQQIAKEQELMAANMTLEEARKISNMEAKRKKMLLEAEFRRHIIEFAREFGITAASRRFKKKASTVKSWMGHLQKSERDAKRQEVAANKEQQELMKIPQSFSRMDFPRLSVLPESPQKSLTSNQKQKTPPQSPSVWEQDFVIKPSSSKSPLKLTFSPRRKSSPIIVIGSSADEETLDEEETNDIETDDEEANVSGEFLEVAAWDLNSTNTRKEKATMKNNDVNIVVDLVSDSELSNKGSSQNKSSDKIVDKLIVDDENAADKATSKSPTKKTVNVSSGEGLDENNVSGETNTSDINIFISPTDVPNILDEINPESETDLTGEVNTEHDQSNDAANEANTDDDEDQTPAIPYEETLMFKLLTEEMDNFFKDETATLKAKKEILINKTALRTDLPKDLDEVKTSSVKKFKRYADAEIMLNIEDTYLFTEGRSTRNAANKEVDLNSSFGSEKLDKGEADLTKSEENKEMETDDKHLESSEKVVDLMSFCEKKITEESEQTSNVVDKITAEQSLESTKIDTDSDIETKMITTPSEEKKFIDTLTDSPRKPERSLFDFLITDNDTIDRNTIKSSEQFPEKNTDEKPKASFSLFGNLMKSLKLPQTTGNGTKASSENASKSDDTKELSLTEPNVEASPSSSDNDLKPKDRTERNLFDFIIPETELPKAQEEPKPEQPQTTLESPRRLTRSVSKSSNSPVKASVLASPVKPIPIVGIKKPMFKFPKLSFSVNFGNIAKLGLAKLKEGEKAKDEKDQVETERNQDRKDDVKITEVVEESKKVDADENKMEVNENKIEVQKMSAEPKGEVIMETFEELRQRLAKQRAASKLEREKDGTNVEEKKANVNDKSSEITTQCPETDNSEIDYEMYKDFTPEKIVLILGISKKHGIEFASTSFGLPVSVIVNWIIEKDRKHRKSALSVSLEDKLCVLVDKINRHLSPEEILNLHQVDEMTLQTWKDEFGWLVKDRRVCDVLEKWKKVEAVTNINFEECEKNLERRDSVIEKEKTEDKVVDEPEICAKDQDNVEVSKLTEQGNPSPKSVVAQTDNDNDSNGKKSQESKGDEPVQSEYDNDVVVVGIEKVKNSEPDEQNVENAESCVKESELQESKGQGPDVLSFLKTTKAKDFTIEQKAMMVLLVDKYGNNLVSKKLGINTGTLYNWRQHKQIRNLLYTQSGLKKFKVVEKSNEDNMQSKPSEQPEEFAPFRETRSTAEKKPPESSKKKGQSSNKVAKKSSTPQSSRAARENVEDMFSQPQGYRVISPTKLPPVLKDLKQGHTKDLTLEQKVAIIKLVQLYGVRTIHKQFRIPQALIWNWQNSKSVTDVLKKEEDSENASFGAQRELDFESGDENEEDDLITIDSILDRTLVAADSMNPMNFKLDQRADVLCLIHHFGVDYVCEKIPQIPRGTLWNWRHNRSIVAAAEERQEMLKKFVEVRSRENVVGDTAGKSDWINKWVKNSQKKRTGQRDESVESIKRRKLDDDDLDQGSGKKKQGTRRERPRRSWSPSTISSEISVHSNDFEEILSDDEMNPPSVLSRRSGASSLTGISKKAGSEQKTSKGSLAGKIDCASVSSGKESDKLEEPPGPDYEVLKIEIQDNDRMMVCYKIPESKEVPSKISKIDTAAKRPASADVAVVEPPAKKRAGKEEVQDDTGNWVPLDEYYYGTHEGDPSYTEEKGEYRFKCWYCSKMLYNNVRAMQHIQGHIDASKQQNIDLSDLTQCKHCYKQFDTPFEMQTHVEKVHLSNKVLMCRICERDFSTPRELTQHMKGNHHACEMPYVCHLCNFRSSMYSDVVDHFKKRHDSSHFMLCLYCLRTFEVKFVSQGWGQTQTYYGHLLKHQTKSSTKKCVVCRLTFFNAIDVKTHRKNCHVGNHLDVKASSHSGKSEAGSSKKRGSQLKSLNAPSVSRIQDYGTVVFPEETNTAKCIECKMIMSSNDHYKKYVHCTMCRFATSCSVAYAKHMMGFHSGQMSSLNMNIPWERTMKDVMYCACGFKSAYGNKVANHLVYCGKWTCYSTQVQASDQTAPSKVEEKTEGSLLGMLGLVSKDQVIPTDDDAEIISSKPRPKCKTKLAVDTSTADTEVITLENTKPAVDKNQTKDNTEEITEDKDIDEQESKSDEKEENKKGKEDDKQILETKIKEPSDDQPSRSVEINKSELTEDKAKGDNSPAEVVETVKNVDENEKKSLEETEVTRETMKEDKPQGMEKEETNSRDNKLESKTEQKDQTASLKVDSKRSNKDQDSEPTSELKTSSEEQMQIGDGDSGRKKESDEMLQEKKEELEIFTDAENKKGADEETKAEQDKEKEVDKDTEVHDLTEDTGAENMEEDKLEEKSKDGQTPEESGKVKEKEYESVEENKPDSMVIEDSAVTTEDKSGEKQDSSISLETQPETSGKDQAGDLERRESQSSDRYSNERDRQSHERDRQSHERDHQSHERDRQSRERDRHNSGGRHEDRPHQDDRNNRSYGSNRSDGYHGNRPYEQNRDRDRSSDRDYNRNQGYRQGDNRSGYGGYQDNRGQGYGGGGNYRGQGGQYGGYHGNRGGHYQDRNRGGNQQGNFNRNSQNRGGYNQNYRGGGYGGGYY